MLDIVFAQLLSKTDGMIFGSPIKGGSINISLTKGSWQIIVYSKVCFVKETVWIIT